jgi:hypothetical protein
MDRPTVGLKKKRDRVEVGLGQKKRERGEEKRSGFRT